MYSNVYTVYTCLYISNIVMYSNMMIMVEFSITPIFIVY